MAKDKATSAALTLANLFSTCVECFGLIHGGPREWERGQHLELTKLGLQQGRLLAWGDAIGICETGEARNALLEEQEVRDKIEAALQAIIDRPAHTDRVTQFEKFGLKPPKRFTPGFEPALDFNRLEAFREKLYYLRERERNAGEVRRGKSATIAHWQIVDTGKFEGFVNLIRENVDALIEMMNVKQRVDMAMRHDIKAFGWHPVFERARAARDMSKLKLVKEVCAQDYPEYAAAADLALAQLDREWHDNYESVMLRKTAQTSEIPGAATKMLAKEKKAEEGRRPSLFDVFRPKSWRKNSKTHLEVQSPTTSTTQPTDVPRSKSFGGEEKEDDGLGPLEPARSKSISAIPMRGSLEQPKDAVLEESDEIDPLARVETSKSIGRTALEPVTSMISRNDQFFTHRASVA